MVASFIVMDIVYHEPIIYVHNNNHGLKCAQFGMDFDTGKIWSHYAVPVDAIPEQGESAAKNPYGVFIKAQTVQNIVRHAGELRSILRSAGN